MRLGLLPFLRLALSLLKKRISLGDSASDLAYSDSGSESSDEDDESSDEDSEFDMRLGTLPTSSKTSLSLETPGGSSNALAESEFQKEVKLSLERAFAEGHSLDNASVELKTLRMASNVPLSRVREAVVSSIVDRIKIIDGGGAPQRQEIANVVTRWGPLINKIGGIDAVETISALQVNPKSYIRLLLLLSTFLGPLRDFGKATVIRSDSGCIISG